jgi:hypothetical protein
MTILDDLLANTGLYIGVDEVVGTDRRGGARMVVTALPGQVGVTLDYEILNPSMPERIRGHVEHTLLARDHDGKLTMVIADDHAGGITFMREVAAGTFEPDGDVPYPMKVVLSMPEPGRLRHSWWYGTKEGGAVERDVATLTRTT